MAVCITSTVSKIDTVQHDRQVPEFPNNLITYYTNATSPWRLFLTNCDDYLLIYNHRIFKSSAMWHCFNGEGFPQFQRITVLPTSGAELSKQNEYACNILVCAHRLPPSGTAYMPLPTCSILMDPGLSILCLVVPCYFYQSEHIHTLTWKCI